MSITDYNSLVREIEGWSKRNDIADQLAGFVRLAEIRIDNVLQLRRNEVRSTLVLNTNDRFAVLPDGFLEMRALRIRSNTHPYDLTFVTPEQMSRYLKSQAGFPQFYTVASRIELDCVPKENYELEMVYFRELVPLSEDNQTNEVIAKYPNLYLYAALAEVFFWARDPEEANNYLAEFDTQINRAKYEQRRGRYGPAPSMRSSYPTP